MARHDGGVDPPPEDAVARIAPGPERYVRLPAGVLHGTPGAHGYHRCRCPECRAWRREYDAEYMARKRESAPTPRRGRPREIDAGRWYVCYADYLTYETHDFTSGPTCRRCGALEAEEEYWESKWVGSVPARMKRVRKQ